MSIALCDDEELFVMYKFSFHLENNFKAFNESCQNDLFLAPLELCIFRATMDLKIGHFDSSR